MDSTDLAISRRFHTADFPTDFPFMPIETLCGEYLGQKFRELLKLNTVQFKAKSKNLSQTMSSSEDAASQRRPKF